MGGRIYMRCIVWTKNPCNLRYSGLGHHKGPVGIITWRFFLMAGGTPSPSHHPFLFGIFRYKPSSYWGTPMTIETSRQEICAGVLPLAWWSLSIIGSEVQRRANRWDVASGTEMWKTKHLMGIEWGYNGAIYTVYIYIHIHPYRIRT